MATKRLSMRQLREILRLRLHAQLSMRQIRDSLRLSLGAIQKVVSQAEEIGLHWDAIEQLNDQQLAHQIYPQATTTISSQHQLPDWLDVYQELKRKGMTKQLLWEEYTQQYPNRSYSYPQYCLLYRRWLKQQKRSMRQIHKAGEKLFVDYAGQTVPIVYHATGEIRTAQIFVAVLGASNYTFCEATWSQQLPDWINSHVRAFHFIGGVPAIVVPDNLKSGVTKACRYDPTLNPSYQQFAAHYGTALVPARPLKPKDKAKAEVGVQIIERWILARLRHQTFFSLAELNHCIKALLEDVNNRPFQQLKGYTYNNGLNPSINLHSHPSRNNGMNTPTLKSLRSILITISSMTITCTRFRIISLEKSLSFMPNSTWLSCTSTTSASPVMLENITRG